MLGKTARKSGKATATPSPGVGGKNIQRIKQQTLKRYGKTSSTAKVPKSARRFSLASDSSLSSVSEDGRNYNNMPVFDSSSDEDEKNLEMDAIMGPSSSDSDSDSDSDGDDVSSEDDPDVDFVLLTKEKKARAIKAAKSRKNPRKTQVSKKYPKPELEKVEKDEIVTEIDFQFQFDSYGNETFKIGEQKEDEIAKIEEDEEDLGEEVAESEFKLMDNSYDSTVLSENNLLKNHLMMDVPKIKEDEINSDEDYEIDDEKLILTLQNDNDDLELAMGDDEDDEDDSEPGEELLDANEFDNLSFEGEEDIDDYDELIENAAAEEDINEDDDNYLLKEETNAITKDFESPHTFKLKQVDEDDDEDDDGFLKYLSEDSVLFDNDDDDGDKIMESDFDEENYELTFFNVPFKDQLSSTTSSRRNNKISKRKFSIHSDTRNEFHWPYVKKSDNDDDDDDDDESSYYSSDDDEEEEEIHLKLITEQQMHSGDSTDEDTSLPKKLTKKLNGSKMVAKEVLSTSETAPPLLGKWKTSENNKPFGIIDGLSTRSLQPESSRFPFATGSNKKTRSTSFSHPKNSKIAEEPMLIDDLLNMSGLEDEDEVINEVDNVGFIFGKKIPLSAFRNKGYVPSVVDSMDQLKKFSMNNKRLVNKHNSPENIKVNKKGEHHHRVKFESDGNLIKKSKRKKKERKLDKLRKQSIVEAAKEGLRTTKSGLFSENTIADVELFLADVDTGDEFSILFRGVI